MCPGFNNEKERFGRRNWNNRALIVLKSKEKEDR
jgi:hypothetical protein